MILKLIGIIDAELFSISFLVFAYCINNKNSMSAKSYNICRNIVIYFGSIATLILLALPYIIVL